MSERTIEILKLAELMVEKDYRSIIDVGCRNSQTYWPWILAHYCDFKPHLTGIDKKDCSEIQSIFDILWHSEAALVDTTPASLVTCISTIEHNLKKEDRINLIYDLVRFSEPDGRIFLTFPFGDAYTNEEYNYSIIGPEEVDEYVDFLLSYRSFTVSQSTFYCESPNGLNQIWWPVGPGIKLEHKPEMGVQQVMIVNAY